MTHLSVTFEPSTLSWVIAPDPPVEAGPAGTATLVAIPDVSLEVDVADPGAWIACTVDLPDAEPDAAPTYEALVLVSELLGYEAGTAIVEASGEHGDRGYPRRVELDPSEAGARNRASLGRLTVLNELAAAELYPSPWWHAEMAVVAGACSPDCGLSDVARRFARAGGRAYARLTQLDADDLDERTRGRFAELGARLAALVDDAALAAEIDATRALLGRARGGPASGFVAEDLEGLAEELRAIFEADTGAVALRGTRDEREPQPAGPGRVPVLPAAGGPERPRYDVESRFGLPARGASLRGGADGRADAVVDAPATLLDLLEPRLAVTLRMLPDRHAAEVRFALREGADRAGAARVWVRLGAFQRDGFTKLVVQSRCWADGAEGVAELALPDAVTLDLALDLELADGPTPAGPSYDTLAGLATQQVRRGLEHERGGDALTAAVRYEDAARRFEDLDDERRRAQTLRLAARAWGAAGDDAQAEHAAAAADEYAAGAADKGAGGAAGESAGGRPAPLGEPYLAEAMRALARRQVPGADD